MQLITLEKPSKAVIILEDEFELNHLIFKGIQDYSHRIVVHETQPYFEFHFHISFSALLDVKPNFYILL
jgi:hypothetical protein